MQSPAVHIQEVSIFILNITSEVSVCVNSCLI